MTTERRGPCGLTPSCLLGDTQSHGNSCESYFLRRKEGTLTACLKLDFYPWKNVNAFMNFQILG